MHIQVQKVEGKQDNSCVAYNHVSANRCEKEKKGTGNRMQARTGRERMRMRA